MKKLLALLLLLPVLVFGQTTVTFTPDTATDFPNPERGWYTYVPYPSGAPTSGSGLANGGVCDQTGVWSIGNLQALVSGTSYSPTAPSRLVHSLCWLDAGNSSIAAGELASIDANFAILRSSGLKTVMRFYYGSSPGPQSPPIATILNHMAQLAPIINKYKDVVFVIQMGMIGNYGEEPAFNTHGTGVTDSDSVTSILSGMNQWLSLLAPDIPVVWECMECIMEFKAWASPLTNLTGFTGSQQARFGFHNDCFLTGAGDSHAYSGPQGGGFTNYVVTSSYAQQRARNAIDSEFIPQGGETCSNNPPLRINCDTAHGAPADESGNSGGVMNEGPRYHWNYLGRYFYASFFSQWATDGCYNSVSTLLGYRIQYDGMSYPSTVTHGTTATFTLTLHNYGWSRVFLERHVTLTLTNGSNVITCVGGGDLRNLPSQSSTPQTFLIRCPIPSGAVTGSYSLSLSMPDAHSVISSNRAYMVRPANAAALWNDTTGQYSTGTSVTVN